MTVETPTTGAGTGFEPRIVAFICNWCTYAAADLAGVSRLQMPPNTLNIRVMCSGRINPMLVIRAFSQGADGVLVSGCHMGDCHYITGNYYARRRLLTLKSVLTGIGIEPERFRVTWISAAEAQDYQRVITEIVENVKRLGPLTLFRDGRVVARETTGCAEG
ncbi:MAG: hydrogenase iron-sulfur subunit [Euryarchaeota archaeon]|nr:hydrogenase iron-sulfur subunit [Euryarchaeota archaeon]